MNSCPICKRIIWGSGHACVGVVFRTASGVNVKYPYNGTPGDYGRILAEHYASEYREVIKKFLQENKPKHRRRINKTYSDRWIAHINRVYAPKIRARRGIDIAEDGEE